MSKLLYLDVVLWDRPGARGSASLHPTHHALVSRSSLSATGKSGICALKNSELSNEMYHFHEDLQFRNGRRHGNQDSCLFSRHGVFCVFLDTDLNTMNLRFDRFSVIAVLY